ncbi:MAG: SPOR domain-containing protein [Acidobacteria bacterium]|nr:SPOR domain-containing protein [Acidobacteriota bacterium]
MWHRISHLGIISLLLINIIVDTRGQAKNYAIQIAAVENQSEAETIVADLKSKGLNGYWVMAEIAGLGTRYRIRIGQFKTNTEARTIAEKYRKRGLIADFFIATWEEPATNNIRQRRIAASSEKNSAEDVAKTAEKIKHKPELEPLVAKPADPPATQLPDDLRQVDAPSYPVRTAEPSPHIGGPPVANALPDLNFKNSNWKMSGSHALTTQNMRTIFFIDSLTGWIGGDDGSVFRTTDGGMSWRPLISGTRADINLIQFVDWNTGWMLGDMEKSGLEGGKSDSDKVLLLTNDGGKTWRQKQLSNVTSIFFIDARTGWAVGRNATILKTTDGGEQWQAVSELEKLIGLPVESTTYNYGFSDIFFLDADHGWIIGNFYGRDRNNIGGLYVTSDGGRNWKRIPLTLQTQYSSGRFTPGVLHSVHFIEQNTGTVSGEMMDGEGRFFFAIHTRDGGRTWQQYRTPSSATHFTQFIDLENGWTAAFAPREGSAEAVIYDTALMKTDNGGMSWQNDFLARGRRIRAIFFLSPSLGWAVGDRGTILKFEDKKKSKVKS